MSARKGLGPGRVGSVAISTALVVAMLAAAMIPWWPIYESPAFFVAAGTAILAGSAIALAGLLRSWPGWLVCLCVVAAYLVLGVPVAVPDQALFGVLPTPAGLVELVAGAALSWKQLVTIAVPVGSYQALLVPPFLLGLVASTAALTIALRTARPAAAVLPPALVLVAGIALGVVHDDFALEAGLAFFVAAVAWFVRIRIADRRAIAGGRMVESTLADARRVLGASALVAVALVGATAAAVALPTPPRNVVRAELQPPFDPSEHDSPLAGFRTAFAPEVADEPMLEVEGLPDEAGLSIAVLDTYDGIVYSVGGSDGAGPSGRFSRVPYRLDQSLDGGTTARIEVTVEGYRDVWVPGVGRLERIEFGGPRADLLGESYFYNDVTATGAAVDGLRSGDRYVAASVVPSRTGLSSLEPGTSVLPALPELPPSLVERLEEWAPATAKPGERLAAVIDGFHRDGYVSHGRDGEEPSRSGHALDRIEELVTDQPMIGDGEQYAVAAALMARQIGFPARVVVGYLPGPNTERDASDGSIRFASADRQAWIEVQTSDGVWVPVDPNPDPRPVPPREPEDPKVVSRPESVLPPPAERTPIVDEAAGPGSSPDGGEDDDDWLQALLGGLEVAGVVLIGVVALCSPLLAIVVAKLRRRRLRRRAATAVERIEGGWLEFADSAADYGYAIVPTATRAEQAATVGGLAPLVLASVVDRAVYAPGGPAAGDDGKVWATVDELQRRLGASRSARDRLRAAISLNSLGGYAVSRRGVRP